MNIRAWERTADPIQNKASKIDGPKGFFSDLKEWLVLDLVIWVVIFACAQIAIWSAGSVEVAETGSGLTADYGSWEPLEIRGFMPGIIEEIRIDSAGTPGEDKHITTPLPAGGDQWAADPTATSSPSIPDATMEASPSPTPSPFPSSFPVAMPTILPNGGTFINSVLVALSCSTTGATIRYTIDGSDPTESSQAYSEPFVLTSSATVKARAFKAGMPSSDVASAAFIVTTSGGSYVDLFAASLTWSPNPVQQGNEVAITFSVRNDGNSTAGSFHVRLTRDGAYMCDWNVSSLGAGQTFQQTCSGTYGIPSAISPGHMVEMIVDDQGTVTEPNESNNSSSMYIPVQAAPSTVDLVAASLTWSPDPAWQGDEVSITFIVRNSGNSAAGSFHLLLTRDGAYMCDWDVSSLGAGQDFQRTCSGSYGIPWANSPGHAVEMIVDDRGAVSESNESNNVLSTYIPVEAVSSVVDLVASSLSWSPDPASQGDDVAITFTVRNNGNSESGSFHVRLTRDGGYMCDWDVSSLGAGQDFQRTCSGSYGIPSASSPGHSVEMIVDDQGVVQESDEGNNTASTFVPVY